MPPSATAALPTPVVQAAVASSSSARQHGSANDQTLFATAVQLQAEHASDPADPQRCMNLSCRGLRRGQCWSMRFARYLLRQRQSDWPARMTAFGDARSCGVPLARPNKPSAWTARTP